MRETLTVLVASSALAAIVGFPAMSAMRGPSNDTLKPISALFENSMETMPPTLIGADADGEFEDRNEEDEIENDDDGCAGAIQYPAPAGATASSDNGLFSGTVPPRAKMN